MALCQISLGLQSPPPAPSEPSILDQQLLSSSAYALSVSVALTFPRVTPLLDFFIWRPFTFVNFDFLFSQNSPTHNTHIQFRLPLSLERFKHVKGNRKAMCDKYRREDRNQVLWGLKVERYLFNKEKLL